MKSFAALYILIQIYIEREREDLCTRRRKNAKQKKKIISSSMVMNRWLMCRFVHGQRSRLTEAFATVETFEWFLWKNQRWASLTIILNSSYLSNGCIYSKRKNVKFFVDKLGKNLLVISEMILSSKCFETHVTRIWPFIGMSSNVNEQIVRFSKMSIAVLTDVFFRSFLSPERRTWARETNNEWNWPFQTVDRLVFRGSADWIRPTREFIQCISIGAKNGMKRRTRRRIAKWEELVLIISREETSSSYLDCLNYPITIFLSSSSHTSVMLLMVKMMTTQLIFAPEVQINTNLRTRRSK